MRQSQRYFLGEGRAADWTESVLEVAAQRWTWLRGEIGQKRVTIGSDVRADLGPMRGGDGRAAVVALSVNGLDFEMVRTVILNRLSQTARMRWRCGDGQSRWGESSHQQKG